jgi:broad specificity phosphatase PhoE
LNQFFAILLTKIIGDNMMQAVLLACSGHFGFSEEVVPTQQIESISALPTTTEEVTRVYFIHNAESEFSAQDEKGTKFTSGRSPEVHLSEKGKEQAKRLSALIIPRIAEAVVFLPPAERAKETAAPMISDTIVMGSTYEELFEVGMGEWEGKPKNQAYKNEYQKWQILPAANKYMTPKVAGGESYGEAANRAIQGLEKILHANPEKTIIIVSGENLLNALAIRWINPPLSKEPESSLPMLPMEKGDFFLVEVPQGKTIEQAKVKGLFHIGSAD